MIKMSRINIDKLYLATITKDETGTGNLTFSVPEYIPGVQQISVKPKVDTGKEYKEGILAVQDTTLSDIEVSFDLSELSNASYAKYLGHTIATQGGVFSSDTDTAPFVAILYKYTKTGGKHGYKVLYKGILIEPDDTIKQKEGKVDYQNRTVTASFQPLTNNGMYQYCVEEDDPDAPTTLDVDFFATVIIPTKKITV